LPDAHELAMISDGASLPLRLWNCFDLFELGPAQFEEPSGFVIVEVIKDVVQHHEVLLSSFHEPVALPFSIATTVYELPYTYSFQHMNHKTVIVLVTWHLCSQKGL
jgi:hypothetical protein